MSIPRILPNDPHWLDQRLLTVHHNNFAYRADVPPDVERWKRRRDFTRNQVALAAGLRPMPQAMPLNPRIWGHTSHEGSVIAKISVETLPGLVLTGNIFYPEKIKNPAPGILCPHGHWPQGRIHHDQRGSVPMRCLMLARLGFVVLCYDMIGKNDNDQLLHAWPLDIANDAYLAGVSPFGLQTWNSLRALDVLCDLPEVDPRRIGCTGTSGGASQTWTVALLDERIKVIAPVCMLSSHFQGGCQCEEGPLLRLCGVTSFDILAAIAPRPLLLPSVTSDWTNLNLRYEVQELRKVYDLFHAGDAIKAFQLDAPHNYNQETREHVYPWFTHWLLNQSLRDAIPEDDVAVPPANILLHSPIPAAPTEESTRQAISQLKTAYCANALPRPQEKRQLADLRDQQVALLSDVINDDLDLHDVVVRVTCPQWRLPHAKAAGQLISRREQGDVIPAIRITPDECRDNTPVCLLIAPDGKQEFFDDGQHSAVLNTVTKHGCPALTIDLMGSGDSADMPARSPRNEQDPSFFAFNPSLFSMRVQDILTTLTLLREEGTRPIVVIAMGEAARPTLCALALTTPVQAAALHLSGVGDDSAAWLAPEAFQPMIHKCGGLKGTMLALAPQQPLFLFNPAPDLRDYAENCYRVAGNPQALRTSKDNFLSLVLQTVGA